MSIQTIAPIGGSFAHDPQYANGRADAYDDSHTLNVDELSVRASLHAEHGDLAFAFGYADRVLEIRMEQAAVTAAETELAHTDHAPTGDPA
jgi:hypothetical protein